MAATAAGGWAREATTSSASALPKALPSSILNSLSGWISSTMRERASSTDRSVEPSCVERPCGLVSDNASIDWDVMKDPLSLFVCQRTCDASLYATSVHSVTGGKARL